MKRTYEDLKTRLIGSKIFLILLLKNLKKTPNTPVVITRNPGEILSAFPPSKFHVVLTEPSPFALTWCSELKASPKPFSRHCQFSVSFKNLFPVRCSTIILYFKCVPYILMYCARVAFLLYIASSKCPLSSSAQLTWRDRINRLLFTQQIKQRCRSKDCRDNTTCGVSPMFRLVSAFMFLCIFLIQLRSFLLHKSTINCTKENIRHNNRGIIVYMECLKLPKDCRYDWTKMAYIKCCRPRILSKRMCPV